MPRGKAKKTILFSDLHIDRWNREKRELFSDFMDHVEKVATEVIVIGDILDFPALEGDEIWPHHKDIIFRLRALPEKGIPLCYIVGNHDHGLRGVNISEGGFALKCIDGSGPLERDLHGKEVCIEHGHEYDPLFQDHIYDTLDFLRDLTGRAVDRRVSEVAGDLMKMFRKRDSKEKSTTKHEVGVPENFLRIWDSAAEQIIKRVRCDIVFFGHTHAPNILQMQGGGWYVNTGDWVAHTSYIEMTRKGLALMEWPDADPKNEIVF